MMTAKVNLNSIATTNMSSEQAKTHQLQQREESTTSLFEKKVHIYSDFIKSFTFFGDYRPPIERKSSKGAHEFHISSSEEKQLVNIISLENPKATETQMSTHQNILNYIKIDQPDRLKMHALSMGGFSYL